MAGKLKDAIQAQAQKIGQGQPYALSLPELPDLAGALPEPLQLIARQYIGARRRTGQALLDVCRWLHEARQIANHGEWGIFLAAIKLDESRARAQIRIHERAQNDPAFAEQMLIGSLSETVARELLSAAPAIQQEVITSGKVTTLRDIRAAKQASTPDLPPIPAQITGTPDPAHIKRLEEQIESGDRVPEARMEIAPLPVVSYLPALPPRPGQPPRRPRQPRSADVSAQRAYVDQLETYVDQADAHFYQARDYINALETLVIALQKGLV